MTLEKGNASDNNDRFPESHLKNWEIRALLSCRAFSIWNANCWLGISGAANLFSASLP